jgi:hypothetical protein
MAYCTKTQVRAQFPLITIASGVTDLILDDYIARADAMINTALNGNNYVTPVVSPTSDIEMWSIYGAGLQSGVQVEGGGQANSPFNWPNILAWYEFIKTEARMGKLAIPKNTYAATVTSDSLDDPDYSEFKTPDNFVLNTDD